MKSLSPLLTCLTLSILSLLTPNLQAQYSNSPPPVIPLGGATAAGPIVQGGVFAPVVQAASTNANASGTNVAQLSASAGVSITNGTINLVGATTTNIQTVTNTLVVTGGGGAGAQSPNANYTFVGLALGTNWNFQNALNAAFVITNYGGLYHIVRSGQSRFTNSTLTGAWSVDAGTAPGPTVAYLLQTNWGTIGGSYQGSGTALDMGPFQLLSYPPYGNSYHYESGGVGGAAPLFYATGGLANASLSGSTTNGSAGVVRHIWFTSYGPGSDASSWYNRTNMELRIYTDFGTNFTGVLGASATNPNPQYLNFRAPIGVLLGSVFRATNQSFSMLKDTRYLRTIEDSVPDGSAWSYFSFGLNMAAPYTNGIWIALTTTNGTVIQDGFSEIDYNYSPPTWPYMNWRLRSYTTNGTWGDGVSTDAGPTPFLNQPNGPGMMVGMFLSCRRDNHNSWIFEGNMNLQFNDGTAWTWTGVEDMFGFAWEMQLGPGAWGTTNKVINGLGSSFPAMTNSTGYLLPATFRDWGSTYNEGQTFGGAVEVYREWGQDAICWNNGAVGFWNQNNGPGGGTIIGFPANIVTLFYAP